MQNFNSNSVNECASLFNKIYSIFIALPYPYKLDSFSIVLTTIQYKHNGNNDYNLILHPTSPLMVEYLPCKLNMSLFFEFKLLYFVN